MRLSKKHARAMCSVNAQGIHHYATQLVRPFSPQEEETRVARAAAAGDSLGDGGPAAVVLRRSRDGQTGTDPQAAEMDRAFGAVIACPASRSGGMFPPVPDPLLLRLLAV